MTAGYDRRRVTRPSASSASFRQYSLTITTTGAGYTTIEAREWDMPNSSYPVTHHTTKLGGVAFPSHRDPLEALRRAIDLLERGE